MFDIQTQLFEGQDIRFGPIDHEKDPRSNPNGRMIQSSCA